VETLTLDRRLVTFRATDAFAVEAYRVSRTLRGSRAVDGLADEIRRTAMRSGGAVVAASGSDAGGEAERRHLERARAAMYEGRYYLHLARRFGMIDLKCYRNLTLRQDAALRELDTLLQRFGAAADRAPP
jgi:four helix bundle protein